MISKLIKILIFLFPLSAHPLSHLSPSKVDVVPGKDEIVFGQTGMLSGHFRQYAHLIRLGILACFEQVNRDGGINGKKLRLISLDDFGLPEKAQENIVQLKALGVDMFIGNMGTRSILKSLQLIEKKEIAVFFPWGGDAQLENPVLINLINGLGFLAPQIKSLADYTINNLGISKIAIFHADDKFSVNAKDVLIQELSTRNTTPVKVAEYNRYTLDIVTPADELLTPSPKAVICISTSLPTVKLVNRFLEKGHFGTTFLGIDSTFFARDILAARGIPFYFSSAVPDPLSCPLGIAQEFRSDLGLLTKEETDINVLSFAYFISAKIIVDTLKNIKAPYTKEKIITQIEAMKEKNLNGFIVNFDAKTRHAFGLTASVIKG